MINLDLKDFHRTTKFQRIYVNQADVCVGGKLSIVTLLLLKFPNDENTKQKNMRCEACGCTALPLKNSREPKKFPQHFSRERLVILVGHLVSENPAVYMTMKREEYGQCLDPQREKFWKLSLSQ